MVIAKPKPLSPGATVAVTCPASPAEPAALERGVERLRALGLRVRVGHTCQARGGIWAGSDSERARELLEFLRDPSIGAIFAGRGGVGCLRLLPFLDGLRRESPPKWIVGRSDLTALHLELWRRLGWVGLSGPMVATDLGRPEPDEKAIERTFRMLHDPSAPGPIETPQLEIWRKGRAEGPLVPANLSLLASMVGTGRLPSLRGAILVIEDIEETPQKIDRMLTQLRLSGALEGLAALVVGQFTDCLPRESDLPPGLSMEVIRDHAAALDVPTLAGYPYGHEAISLPLPIGVRARLKADPPGLEILEGAAA